LVRNRCRKVNNVEVIGRDRIDFELYDGRWHRTRLAFDSEEELRNVIRRAVQHDYKPDINDDNCMMESKGADGSRITAILRPAGDRDYLFVKMFNSFSPTGENYLKEGSITPEIIRFTRLLLKAYCSVAVIGGINRGKTAFLKYLTGLLEPGARIGTLEPDFEMQLRELYPERNIVSLQEHPNFPMNEGFKKLLRTNRDVIIIGEARGKEVAEAARAARRGIGCTLLTAHVVDPESLPEEFADMYCEEGKNADTGFLMYRFAKAFNITYRLRQLQDGRRVVDDVSEIVAETGNRGYRVNRLFRYDAGKGTHIRVGGIEQERLVERMRYYNLGDEEIEYLTYRPEGQVE
ncbi:MAG: ATPase, T2SS/T4P/T4SS family, partial [Bacillota bacterium]|nr:ATPase, T2SS/T4P/T4SS family [Bacillota bacterium]